ncbi:MAG: aminopeptidase P family protein [Rhizobiales bacterium]|nr:Xaa-Pro peptidase family protein [Hyphomicrobiales bacterium]NRB15504.1 aminopeptidase P family protein [Hyphomicrobiales bacterium]
MSFEISNTRLKQLRQKMRVANVGLLALGPAEHMQWLLGFHPHADERPCLLLITADSEAFLMPSLNAEGSRDHTDIKFFKWSDDEGPAQALTAMLSELNLTDVAKIAVDETMRADFALLLLGQLPNTEHQFTSDTLGILRMKKDQTDYVSLKENALICDGAMQAGFEAIKIGVSETDIQAVIKDYFAAHHAPMLFGIVGIGSNGAFPHHQTGERLVQDGDVVLIDIGGKKGIFPSDMTRMAIVNEAPEDYHKIHAIVEAAVCAALKAAKPGVRAAEVDAAAREVIELAGYGEYFVHRTGHGLGLELHEPPYITATSETILEAGMVFSIEPGIYLPGKFGIRLEEIVILREDGPEILSELSRKVRVV